MKEIILPPTDTLYLTDSLPDNTYATLGGYSGIVANGFSLHSPDVAAFLAAGAPGPFSLEHLAAATDNAYQESYRDWMQTGTTYTGGKSSAYIGQKTDHEHSDLYVQCALREDIQPFPDRIRFGFTGKLHQDPTGANSEEGLEGMRLFARSPSEVFVGFGDFHAANVNSGGAITEPEERIDVVDGRVRVRQLPTDPVSTSDQFVTVNTTTGVLEHRPITAATSCEWTLLGAPGSNNNIATAYNGNPGCPQENRMVGIGTTASTAYVPHTLTDSLSSTTKLHVFTDNFGTAMMARNLNANSGTNFGLFTEVSGASFLNAGIEVLVRGAASYSSGVRAKTFGAITEAYAGAFLSYDSANITTGALGQVHNGVLEAVGLRGRSYANANLNYGVFGFAQGDGLSATKRYYGVWGESRAGGTGVSSIGLFGYANGATTNYGLYAGVGNTPIGSTNWAGYFQGNVHISGIATCTAMMWGSDESIKTNVEPIENAMDQIGQLHPKTYDFLVDEHPVMGLPQGLQRGLIAQQVADVFPDLVADIKYEPVLDSMGAVIVPGETIKGVNYVGLIPMLIAGMQEQQATIAQMQTQLDQCCAANPGMAPGGDGSLKSAPAKEDVQEQRLVIQPNPFTDHTTLSYYVPQAGKVSLQVSTSDGRPLGTLREEQAEAGAYTYEWNTSKLASGTYFCTFMLDGAVVVKRAVKVAR